MVANIRKKQAALFTERVAKLPVKVLAPYVKATVELPYQCLRCGSTGVCLPCQLTSDKFCRTCGMEKRKANYLANHGVEHHFHIPSIRKKFSNTMKSRYGHAHALQNKELHDKQVKNGYSRIEYKLGRRSVTLQGYEPQGLTWLLANTTIKPKHIVCGVGGEIPSIPYVYFGKAHVYHPDIFVPSRKLLIEVKSSYTYSRYEKRNLAKQDACKNLGYRFVFLVMNAKGERLNGKSNKRSSSKTRKS